MSTTLLSNRIPPWLFLMGVVTAIGPLAVDMYLPSFPFIAQDFGVPTSQIERTLAGYLLGLSIAQLAYGPLTDRFGRKIPLVTGLSIFIVASLMSCLASSASELTFWRVIQAFGSAAGMVIPRAVIRDNLETRDAAKALSLIMLIMGVTPILAPLLGGQILKLGSWRGIFLVMAAGAALLLASTLTTMRETLTKERRSPLAWKRIALSYADLLRDKIFIGYALAGGFGSAGMFSYIAGSPRTFIEIYGIDPSYFGLLFGANAVSLIFSSQVSARLLSRHTPQTLLRRAQNCMLVAVLIGLLLALTGIITLPLLMTCLICYMACQGFVNPNSAALALDRQGHRLGIASALMGSMQMLAGSLAGIGISVWHADSALPLTGLLALCGSLSWLCGRIAMHAVAKLPASTGV